jgi:hypothetical protein
MVAQRCQMFNEQQSPLVKLPNEILVAIGELVLASHKNHDKHAFRSVLPLLQTCTRLRSALEPLRSKRILCETKCGPGNRFPLVWHDVMHKAEHLRRKGPHHGPITFFITGSFFRTQLRDLVHMAANERSFCGAEQEDPSVYIEVPRPAWSNRKGKVGRFQAYFVTRDGEINMLGFDRTAALSDDPCSHLGPVTLEEAADVWSYARSVHMA